jgi:hypothetical protein
MKETELAQKFVQYLSDFDLYFEVDYGGCVDIVALMLGGRVSLAVEVKTTFNFKVLDQALNNQQWFNYSYIGVPAFRDDWLQRRLCADYGIGLLVYNDKHQYQDCSVSEIVKPKLMRRSNVKLRQRLHERNKLSLPGAQSGTGERMTAFKVTHDNLYKYVRRNPGCTIRQAMDGVAHHYNTNKAAASNIYSWIYQGVIKDIIYKQGKLYIKPVMVRTK